MKLAFAAALVAAASASFRGGYQPYAPIVQPKVAPLAIKGGYGRKGSYAKLTYQPVTKVVQRAASRDQASAGYGRQAEKRVAQDWDAWGRDQDLAIDESYGKTHAKSYAAESYDEWDNKDDDKWGAQAWGKDRDMSAASSKVGAASQLHKDAYGDAGYGAAAQAKKAQKGYQGHLIQGYGGKQLGYGGYGKGGQIYGGQQALGYAGGYGKQAVAQQAYGAQGYGAEKQAGASIKKAAQRSMYDNDEWAKQAYGSDFDSRYGKSYDSVQARQYDNEHYAREVRADDDQWAEDYDRFTAGHDQDYGQAASDQQHNIGKGWGLKKGGLDSKAASAQRGGDYDRKMAQDWDAYGRDQDFHEKVSYDQTRAKAYSAESYDEWDNEDADKWGAQAWGKDRDVLGASSYGKRASSGKYGQYGADYGQAYGKGKGKGLGLYGGLGGYGKGPRNAGAEGAHAAQDALWEGASKGYGAAKLGYDNDAFAKQAYGQDADSRYGKSYDSVSARSYDNEKYARWLQADDDQWAEDYDSYDSGMADAYGRGASLWTDTKGKGLGLYGKGKGELDAASKQGRAGTWGKSGSDWDAYGRDQDLEVDESYEATWAKSYDAESYDEWDNKDDDRWGAQAWGKDRDLFGASSEGARASEGDKDRAAYGAQGAYQAGKKGAYGQSIGLGYGGVKGLGYGGYAGQYGALNASAYGGLAKQSALGAAGAGAAKAKEAGASLARTAAVGAYDNDEWAKQAYGRDFDSRYGKSYDSVAANSYDDEQYARKVRADDDQWAEDYDRRQEKDTDAYSAGASREYQQPTIKKTVHVPHIQHGSYGSYGGYGRGQW